MPPLQYARFEVHLSSLAGAGMKRASPRYLRNGVVFVVAKEAGGVQSIEPRLKQTISHDMATTGKYLATQEEMVQARLSLGSRDLCSKLLIPLNKCRVASFYLPWECEDERHGYEKCEYELFLQRMKKMQEMRLQGDKQAIPAAH